MFCPFALNHTGIWYQEKESLITDLRRELRVSDDEHRELLSRVNADETIRRIRFVILKILVDEKHSMAFSILSFLYSIVLLGSGGSQEHTKLQCSVRLSPFMICYQVLQFQDLARNRRHPNWYVTWYFEFLHL